jgi:hypothetical protein
MTVEALCLFGIGAFIIVYGDLSGGFVSNLFVGGSFVVLGLGSIWASIDGWLHLDCIDCT